MDLTPEQAERLGDAVANVEEAISTHHEMLHSDAVSPGSIVGEMLILALALKGFVIYFDPVEAARTAAAMERLDARPN